MSTSKKSTTKGNIYDQEIADRRALAALPIEEKIKRLIKLQEMNASVARSVGREYKQPWNINFPEKTDT